MYVKLYKAIKLAVKMVVESPSNHQLHTIFIQHYSANAKSAPSLNYWGSAA